MRGKRSFETYLQSNLLQLKIAIEVFKVEYNVKPLILIDEYQFLHRDLRESEKGLAEVLFSEVIGFFGAIKYIGLLLDLLWWVTHLLQWGLILGQRVHRDLNNFWRGRPSWLS